MTDSVWRGHLGAERRAACDAACESLGTWIWDLGSRGLERGNVRSCRCIYVIDYIVHTVYNRRFTP